jgi:uncharacterized membrane protein
MTWVYLSFLTAFLFSISDIAKKYSIGREADEYVVAWAGWLFALPIALIALIYAGIPDVDSKFWIVLMLQTFLLGLSSIFYVKAIKHSDLSLVIPLLTFTPALLLITSPIIVGEFPNLQGIIGIFFIVVGSYGLNLSQRVIGVFEPFRALLRDRGARYMFLVSIMWSVTANLEKVAVLSSSSTFYVFSINLSIALVLSIFVFRRSKDVFLKLFTNKGIFSIIGASSCLGLICQMMALQLTIVPNVIAIKRTSILMSIILGAILFKEETLKERFGSAVLMVIGASLIVLG